MGCKNVPLRLQYVLRWRGRVDLTVALRESLAAYRDIEGIRSDDMARSIEQEIAVMWLS